MAAHLTGKVYALSDLLCRRDEDFDNLCNVLLKSDLIDLQEMTMKMEELELPAKGILSKLLHTRRVNEISRKIQGSFETANEDSFESILILIDTLICNKDQQSAIKKGIKALELELGENPSFEDFKTVFEKFSAKGINYQLATNCSLFNLLKTQQGMPVIICALVVLLAKRKKLKFFGVNLPGYFILAQDCTDGIIRYYDPSNEGFNEVSKSELRQLTNHYGYDLQDEMLDPVGETDILIRIMNNLYRIWAKQSSSLKFRAAGSIIQMMKGV
ncbi:transglutaminase family protein [Lentisphaera profundi]|uniref:Transglutaminase family protein n=1 Tax=Lentisphaera profundi TaxID=1658616 RepID=A0ABY7VYR7_9BACT|nr:transglutaminase family protein [Lentisphaera profundi]WDE97931.1 transglutaminase family protein [Lentisphaera profundi]